MARYVTRWPGIWNEDSWTADYIMEYRKAMDAGRSANCTFRTDLLSSKRERADEIQF
eukprot:COSAG06_NODE_2580_length_6620_cov_7.408373_8_plen_57_part_00